MKVNGFRKKLEGSSSGKKRRKREEASQQGPFQPVTGILRPTLELILEASNEALPNEFSGTLRATGGIIDEVMILPGTIQGETSAIMQLHMLPVDLSVVGSVHSHPSGVPLPSGADLQLFAKFGYAHIITAEPFRLHDWRAYDHRGQGLRLKIVRD